jgi:hypothetical protein
MILSGVRVLADSRTESEDGARGRRNPSGIPTSQVSHVASERSVERMGFKTGYRLGQLLEQGSSPQMRTVSDNIIQLLLNVTRLIMRFHCVGL